LLFISHQGAQS